MVGVHDRSCRTEDGQAPVIHDAAAGRHSADEAKSASPQVKGCVHHDPVVQAASLDGRLHGMREEREAWITFGEEDAKEQQARHLGAALDAYWKQVVVGKSPGKKQLSRRQAETKEFDKLLGRLEKRKDARIAAYNHAAAQKRLNPANEDDGRATGAFWL